MELDKIEKLDKLVPGQYLRYQFKNPMDGKILSTKTIRISVLDKDCIKAEEKEKEQKVGAIIVPIGRESDWIFSRKSGHQKLLKSYYGISRLLLVANWDNGVDVKRLNYSYDKTITVEELSNYQTSLKHVVGAMHPLSTRGQKTIFLKYWDGLLGRITRYLDSTPTGLVHIVDEEVSKSGSKVIERRMYCESTAGWLQYASKVDVVGMNKNVIRYYSNSTMLDRVNLAFEIDSRHVVEPWGQAMLHGLTIVKPSIGAKPLSCCCVGVKAGTLPGFLASKMGFDVKMVIPWDQSNFDIVKAFFQIPEEVECLNLEPHDFLSRAGSLCRGEKIGESRANRKLKVLMEKKIDIIMVSCVSTHEEAPMGVRSPSEMLVSQAAMTNARSILSCPDDPLFTARCCICARSRCLTKRQILQGLQN